jgi:hypothetical protein
LPYERRFVALKKARSVWRIPSSGNGAGGFEHSATGPKQHSGGFVPLTCLKNVRPARHFLQPAHNKRDGLCKIERLDQSNLERAPFQQSEIRRESARFGFVPLISLPR